MGIVESITGQLLGLHSIAAYVIIGALAFGEAGLLIGFVLPGETAVILGGVLAAQHAVSLPIMLTVAITAAILGDSAGYEIGRRVGPRLLRSRLYARHGSGIARGEQLLVRHGGKAVLLGRFTAFLRAVLPGLAGMAGMPYRRFLAWNTAGGIVWAGGLTLLGVAAGNSYSTIEDWTGRGSVVLAIAAATVIVAVLVRRHVATRRRVAAAPTSSPSDSAASPDENAASVVTP